MIDRITAMIASAMRHRHTAPHVARDALFAELDIDDLERVEIAIAVEEEWGIELPDAEVLAWIGVEDIAGSVAARQMDMVE